MASTLHIPSHLSLATPLIYLGRKRARILGGSMTILHMEEMKQRGLVQGHTASKQ